MWISYAVSDREVENRCPKSGCANWPKKEVINCCDCKKLGYIDDLIIDDCKGCIEALSKYPERWENGVTFLEMEQSISYHFPASKEIGPDLILVEIHEEK